MRIREAHVEVIKVSCAYRLRQRVFKCVALTLVQWLFSGEIRPTIYCICVHFDNFT